MRGLKRNLSLNQNVISEWGVSKSLAVAFLLACALPAFGQSFRVQCPAATNLHPDPKVVLDANGKTTASSTVNAAPKGSTYAQAYPGNIDCQQVSGGDGYVTMGDGHQIYLFGFGPLSGLQDIYAGLPGRRRY